MRRIRVIPVIQISEKGCVKTTAFKNPVYIGDPINTVKLFNDKEVDELAIVSVSQNRFTQGPNFELLQKMAAEAFMPMAYGGGISSLDQASRIFDLGFEKIIIGTSLLNNSNLVSSIASKYGEQSIVGAIDYSYNWLNKPTVRTHSGTQNTSLTPLALALKIETMGVGEILLTCIDREGSSLGYDLKTMVQVAEKISIPLIAHGGANHLDHFKEAILVGKASAVAAGSMMVFKKPHNAVLIQYPDQKSLEQNVYTYIK
jgi:cyclase